MRKNLARLIALGFLAASATAGAQWDPESGDTGQWQPPPEEQPPPQQQQPPPQQQQQQQPPPQQQETPWGGQPEGQQQQQQQQSSSWGQQEETPPPATEEPAGDTDHSKVSFGVSFIGFERFQLEPGDRVNDADAGPYRLPMTTVGIRLWVTEMIGLDIGLGLGIATDSYDNADPDGPTVQTGRDGAFGLRVHFGLPVALQTYEHFNILLIPELAFTYGATTFIVNPNDIEPGAPSDVDVSAIALDVGVKVGGELHFGFWGVPNLSLQATIGIGLRYASRTAENSLDFPSGGFGVTNSGISLQTLGQQLGSSIRINYYF